MGIISTIKAGVKYILSLFKKKQKTITVRRNVPTRSLIIKKFKESGHKELVTGEVPNRKMRRYYLINKKRY